MRTQGERHGNTPKATVMPPPVSKQEEVVAMAEGGSTGQAWGDDTAAGDMVAASFLQDEGREERESACLSARVSERAPTKCGR